MDVQHLIEDVRDTLTVQRVFGPAQQRDGVTLIPVAVVRGGGGGGEGHESDGDTGHGGGIGLSAKPAGVFVLSADGVRWRPALDLNRLVAGAQIVAVVALLTVRSIVKARLRVQAGR